MNIKGSVHLKIYERIKIQELLQENASCKSIATLIGKDDRSISNEIKNNACTFNGEVESFFSYLNFFNGVNVKYNTKLEMKHNRVVFCC